MADRKIESPADTPHPAVKGLSSDFISELMGKTRTRNQYGPKLLEFVESDEAGINPAEAWPVEFGSKNATTMYQGFMKAARDAKLTETVLIKQSEGSVFLLHKERVALALAAASNGDA